MVTGLEVFCTSARGVAVCYGQPDRKTAPGIRKGTGLRCDHDCRRSQRGTRYSYNLGVSDQALQEADPVCGRQSRVLSEQMAYK